MKKLSTSYQIHHSLQSVFDFFSDLNRFSNAHPLIISLEKAGGVNQKFKVREQPFKFLPIKISYFAVVNTQGNKVIYSISGIPLTTFELTFDLVKVKPKETLLNYHIEIKSKLVGKGILLAKIKKAQDHIIDNLDDFIYSE